MNPNWLEEFSAKLDFFGHRNWVLVTDKAYPQQSSQGMTMLDSGEELPAALAKVISVIGGKSHVRPLIYIDQEMDFLDDSFCPGISGLRSELDQVLSDVSGEVSKIPHEEIIRSLDEKSKLFNIIVVKTEAVLPYTSVFIELDCGYWSAAQEAELRNRMK